MVIHIMCAVPGAGKSTFIKERKKEDDIVICPDEIRKELTGDISDQSKNKEVWDTAYDRLYKNVSEQSNDIWFDATNCKVSSITKLIGVIQNAATETDILVDVNLEVMQDSYEPDLCKHRIHTDISDGIERSNVPDEVVDRMFATFSEIDFEKVAKDICAANDCIENCFVKKRFCTNYKNHCDSDFIKMVKQEVVERLEDRKLQRMYVCDIGMALSENENCNGSWYCSAYQARESIKEYLYEFEAYCSFYKSTFGEPEYINDDEYNHSLESVHCRMMIFAIESAFNAAYNKAEDKEVIDNVWNEKILIDDDFIDAIKVGLKEIEEVEDIW